MTNCTDCKYACWQRTKSGRLHPSGDGRCGYPFRIPQLPGAFYWLTSEPLPHGGLINRKTELKGHCPYYRVKNEREHLIDEHFHKDGND